MTANKLPASILPLTVIKRKIILSPTHVIHLCSLPPQKKEEHYKSLSRILIHVFYGVNRAKTSDESLPFESDTLAEPTFILTTDYT